MKFVINPKFIPAVRNRSQQALKKAWLYMETMLKKAVPKDTGDLQKSIFHELISEKTVRVWSMSWSAYVVEHGREPGKMPPLDALVGWVIRRFWLLWSKTQPREKQPKETKSAVWAVARKIRDKGISAKHLFSETREANKDKATKIYFDTLKR